MSTEHLLEKLENNHAMLQELASSVKDLHALTMNLTQKVADLSASMHSDSDTEEETDLCSSFQYLCVNNKMPQAIQMQILYETYKHNALDPQGWTVDEIHETSTHIVGTAKLRETLYNLTFAIDLDNGFRATATPMHEEEPPAKDWGRLGYVKKFDVTAPDLTLVVGDVVAYFTPPGKASQ